MWPEAIRPQVFTTGEKDMGKAKVSPVSICVFWYNVKMY